MTEKPTATTCGGRLPAGWYRDRDTLVREVEAHGTMHETARAHGCGQSTLSKWWANHELPPRPHGTPPGGGLEPGVAKLAPTDPRRIADDRKDAELRHLRRENRQLRDELAARETVVERIIDAARVEVDVPSYRVARPKRKLPERAAILPVFDCQFGQLVKPADTPLGVGAFDTAVFDQRLDRWLEAATGSMRDYAASHRITELVLAFGGDLVEGADIFRGQPWQLELDPARQTVEWARRWATVLGDRLLPFAAEELGVSRFRIYAVPGNHGKVGGKAAGATPSTMSWDWLAVEWLRDSLRGHRAEWGIEPGGALLFECADHLFLTIHGDEIRGWGGLPYYGIAKYDGRAMRLTGEVFDYVLMGHHHQPASIPNGSGGEYIVSGDWVGANNLTRFIGQASRPQQRLLFVSSKYGVTEQVPLYLSDVRRERPHIYRAEAAA